MTVRPAALLASAIVAIILGEGAGEGQSQMPTVVVGTADYPENVTVSSRRTVRLRYTVSGEGRVNSCNVRRSSGQSRLDQASCEILTTRGRFSPSQPRGEIDFLWLGSESAEIRAQRGAPLLIAGSFWIMDADYPPEARRARIGGTTVFEADVTTNGRAARCRIVESSGAEVLDRRTCEIVLARAAFIAASDGRGGSQMGTYRGRLRWRPI